MSNLKYCIKESIINGLSWLSKNQIMMDHLETFIK